MAIAIIKKIAINSIGAHPFAMSLSFCVEKGDCCMFLALLYSPQSQEIRKKVSNKINNINKKCPIILFSHLNKNGN